MDCMKQDSCKPYKDEKSMMRDSLENMPLAMAYIPWQQWQKVLDAHKGLEHGTIFEELILPFYGAKAACMERPQNNYYGRRGYRS